MVLNNTNKETHFYAPIIKTIKSAPEIMADLGDCLINFVTNNEEIEKVPVIGTAVKVLKLKDAYHLYRLKRNVFAFIRAVADCDREQIERLSRKVGEDASYAEEFADTMMSILLEATKPIKAQVVGKLVCALSREDISLNEFQEMSQLIQNASIPALHALPIYFNSHENKSGVSKRNIVQEPLLLSLGVCSRLGNRFRISDIGIKIYVHGFEGQFKA